MPSGRRVATRHQGAPLLRSRSGAPSSSCHQEIQSTSIKRHVAQSPSPSPLQGAPPDVSLRSGFGGAHPCAAGVGLFLLPVCQDVRSISVQRQVVHTAAELHVVGIFA